MKTTVIIVTWVTQLVVIMVTEFQQWRSDLRQAVIISIRKLKLKTLIDLPWHKAHMKFC
jgi:hypothetical protein